MFHYKYSFPHGALFGLPAFQSVAADQVDPFVTTVKYLLVDTSKRMK